MVEEKANLGGKIRLRPSYHTLDENLETNTKKSMVIPSSTLIDIRDGRAEQSIKFVPPCC